MTGLGGLTSGNVLLGEIRGPAWWLVDPACDGVCQVLAGPFADRTDAGWAAAQHPADGARPEYGLRRPDGWLVRRPSPEECDWFTQLEEQLDRLPEGWDAGLADDDPLVTLVVEITAALTDAGLPLHDARESGAAGGVCLAPEPLLGGAVVTWRQHDRASVDQVHGTDLETRMQRVMSRAVADVLRLRAFTVEKFGASSGVLVRWGT